MMEILTVERAKKLIRYDILIHRFLKDKSGRLQRWFVCGAPQIWARSPKKVKVPIRPKTGRNVPVRHLSRRLEWVTEKNVFKYFMEVR